MVPGDHKLAFPDKLTTGVTLHTGQQQFQPEEHNEHNERTDFQVAYVCAAHLLYHTDFTVSMGGNGTDDSAEQPYRKPTRP